jgi:hypothetical protein
MNNLLLKEYIKSIILNENYSFYGKNINKILQDLNKICNENNYYNIDITSKINNYLSNIIKPLNDGSYRIVYPLDNDFVIKVALSSDGIKSNKTEKEAQKILGKYSAKVFYHQKDFYYILSERCDPVNSQKEWITKALNGDVGLYNKLYNLVSKEYNSQLVKYIVYYIIGISIDKRYLYDIFEGEQYDIFDGEQMDPEDNNDLLSTEFAKKVIELYQSGYKYAVLDSAYRNLGFGSDGRPVFIDMGSTD